MIAIYVSKLVYDVDHMINQIFEKRLLKIILTHEEFKEFKNEAYLLPGFNHGSQSTSHCTYRDVRIEVDKGE